MAIYRLSAQVISRGDGRSATAAAAYRSGGRIFDARANLMHDYERRHGVVYQEIMAPPQTPGWMLDREALWNAVERVEKRKDAQLCREVQLALPHELGRQRQLELVRGFVAQEFVARGMISDIAIHDADRRGDRRNAHVHVMLTLREVTGDGFGNKERGWNDKTLLGHWREQWAGHVNRALAEAGHAERVDHRTLVVQRLDAERQAAEVRGANDNQRAQALEIEAVVLDREPQPKVGHGATALERKGHRTERGGSLAGDDGAELQAPVGLAPTRGSGSSRSGGWSRPRLGNSGWIAAMKMPTLAAVRMICSGWARGRMDRDGNPCRKPESAASVA